MDHNAVDARVFLAETVDLVYGIGGKGTGNAFILPAALKKRGFALTRSQLLTLLRVLRECRKRNRGWKLIEAETADGQRAEVSL